MHALHSKKLYENKKLWLIFVGLIVCVISLLIFVNASFADSDTGSDSDSDSNYSSEVLDDSNDGSYLTFAPIGGQGFALNLYQWGHPDGVNLQWNNTDPEVETSWHQLEFDSYPTSSGQNIYIRGIDNNSIATSSNDYWYLLLTPYGNTKVNVSGNIMSLLDYQSPPTAISSDYCFCKFFNNVDCLQSCEYLSFPNSVTAHCYESMFEGCEKLTSGINMGSVNSLAPYCYANMFKGCSALTDSLYFTWIERIETLAEGCYMGMFSGTAIDWFSPELGNKNLTKFCYKSMFEDCKNLYRINSVEVKSLAPYCFENMVKGCTNFTEAWSIDPLLVSSNLAEGCYMGMLSNTSITDVPNLRGEQLSSRCYQSLFEGCEQLTSANWMSIRGVEPYCCANMFSGCSKLTVCSIGLFANNLKEGCYSNMFKGCASLKYIPDLPATSLAEGCYEGMFQGSGIASAPDLPATTLAPNCYKEMFEGCVNLTHIKVSFTQWPQDDTSFSNWMAGVSPTGFFECPDELDTSIRDASHIPAGWKLANKDLFSFSTTDVTAWIYYNFEMLSGGKSVNLKYSINCVDWISLTVSESTTEPVVIAAITPSQKLFIYGDNLSGFNDANSCLSFVSEQNIKVHGKSSALISLDSSETIPNPYCFKGLFKGCSGLSNMLELPYTQLTEGCYQSMYEGCTNLESLCELPARELQKNCYAYMFKDCTSITKAPELSATELKDGCYMGMFEGCNALTKLKVGFESWFDDGQHYSFEHVPTDGWLKDTQNMFLNAQQFYCPPDLDTDRIQDDSHVPTYWLAQKDAKISATISGYKAQYDGRKHKITVTLTSPIDAKVEYKGPEDDDFKESNPEFKDAGTYTVEVKISKASYVTLETSADVVIQKSTSGIMSIGDYEKLYSGAEPDYTATFKGLDITPEKGKDYITYRDAGEDVLENNGTYTVHAVWINENSNFDVAEATGSLKIDKASAKLVADKNSMSEGEAMPTLTAHLEGARFGVDDLASDDYFVEPVNNGNGTYTLNPNLTEKGQRFLSNFNVEMVPSVMRVYSAGGSGGGSTPGGSGGVATQVIDNGVGDASASETAMTSTLNRSDSSDNDDNKQGPINPLTIASIVANVALLGGLIFLILKLKKVF